MNKISNSSFLNKSWILSILALGALVGGSLQASESTPAEEKSRPEIGTRALSHTEWLSRATLREELDSSDEETNSVEDSSDQLTAVPVSNESRELGVDAEQIFVAETNSEGESSTLQSRSALTARAVYYTTHSGVYRHPNVVWSDGSHVELDDGSVWYVSIYDRALTLNWWTNDTVLIMPNAYDALFQYKLVNQQTGAYVRVNLEKAPYYNGAYTYFITAIDYFGGKVWLNDGTVWSTAFSDGVYTSRWLPNDTVIMGFNDGSLWDLYPNILINVSTLEYSRCKCLY